MSHVLYFVGYILLEMLLAHFVFVAVCAKLTNVVVYCCVDEAKLTNKVVYYGSCLEGSLYALAVFAEPFEGLVNLLPLVLHSNKETGLLAH